MPYSRLRNITIARPFLLFSVESQPRLLVRRSVGLSIDQLFSLSATGEIGVIAKLVNRESDATPRPVDVKVRRNDMTTFLKTTISQHSPFYSTCICDVGKNRTESLPLLADCLLLHLSTSLTQNLPEMVFVDIHRYGEKR